MIYVNNLLDKDMQDCKGCHCGDHVESKHWTDKKIEGGNCADCGPVRVQISRDLTESNFLSVS